MTDEAGPYGQAIADYGQAVRDSLALSADVSDGYYRGVVASAHSASGAVTKGNADLAQATAAIKGLMVTP